MNKVRVFDIKIRYIGARIDRLFRDSEILLDSIALLIQ